MFGQSAPSHGEDVSGVEGTPVVEGASPAIKHDEDLLTSDLSHCGRANEVGVLPVHSLQFHTRLEVVFSRAGGFLTDEIYHMLSTDVAYKSTTTMIIIIFIRYGVLGHILMPKLILDISQGL